ncbi:MAG: hypothetical protein MZW92_46385 [Comamonadaceae bacterium]|nr:hypothetical protein [Comamonadaceae bacterium]
MVRGAGAAAAGRRGRGRAPRRARAPRPRTPGRCAPRASRTCGTRWRWRASSPGSGLDHEVLAAAILHDVAEDTEHHASTTSRREFGARIAAPGGRRDQDEGDPRVPSPSGAHEEHGRPRACARCCWRWPRTSAWC